MDFAHIENLRKQKGFTQSQLAESIDMSLFGYQKAIKTNDIKVSTLEKIAIALNVDILVFFRPVQSKVSDTLTSYKTEKKQDCDEIRQELSFYKSQYDSDRNTIKALTLAVNSLTTQLEKNRIKKT